MIVFILVLIGSALIIYGAWNVCRVMLVYSYKKAPAIVESADLDIYKRPEVYVTITYYIPKISYSYEVSGRKYIGRVVFPHEKYIMFTDEVAAKHFMTNLQKTSVVFYDGDDPYRAVLYRPSKGRIIRREGAWPIAGMLLVGCAFLVYLLG